MAFFLLGESFRMPSVSIHITAPSLGIVQVIGYPCSLSTAAVCSPRAGATQISPRARAALMSEKLPITARTLGARDSRRVFSRENSSAVNMYGLAYPSDRASTPMLGRYQSHIPILPRTLSDQRIW